MSGACGQKKVLNLSNLISTIGVHVVSHCLNATIGQKYMVGAFSFIQTTFAESPANRIYFFENQICLKFVYFQLNVDREVLYIEVSLKGSPEDFSFHPAKFDNFKDE